MSSGTASHTKSARLRRVQWIAVASLTAAGIINYVDRSALSIANTAIRDEMALSPAEMGWLLSAFSLAYTFSQLPVGALLAAAAVAVPAAVATIVLVRKPLEGSETLILSERTA